MRTSRFEFRLKPWHWLLAASPLVLFAAALLFCGGNGDRLYRQNIAEARAGETCYQARLAKLLAGPSKPEKIRKHDTPYRVLIRHGWKEEDLTERFASDLIAKRNPKVRFWKDRTVQVPLPDKRSRS